MKKYLSLFLLLFLIPFIKVSALSIDEVSWSLSPNQYIRSLSGGTDQYSYNSSNWGNYSINNYRSVYEYGAYVTNPVCEDDYCLVEDKSYIMSFFINSSKNFSSNFASILSDNSNIHIRVSYINTSNQKVWVILNSADFNYYVIQKINDKSYQFSLIFTMPKLPSNSNTSHFVDLDFWVLPTTSYPNNELLYTGNANVTTGINNFSIENATPSNLIAYITRIKQVSQNQLIISEQQTTTQAIEDMTNMDIGNSEKQLPNDSDYTNYENKENQLKNFINTASTNDLSISLDTDSSNWVWTTLTSLIQSNMLIFGMFIAILSVGVIKLILGR